MLAILMASVHGVLNERQKPLLQTLTRTGDSTMTRKITESTTEENLIADSADSDHEPDTSVWLRLLADLLSPLAPDEML